MSILNVLGYVPSIFRHFYGYLKLSNHPTQSEGMAGNRGKRQAMRAIFCAAVSLMVLANSNSRAQLATQDDSLTNQSGSVTITNQTPTGPPSPPAPVTSPPMVLTNPPPGAVPQFPSFSGQPSTEEIGRAKIFDEPLIPTGGQPSQEENNALAQALMAFANRTNGDDFSALTTYLQSSPNQHWYGSVLFCLGSEYYNTGFYSKAIDAWDEAWEWLQNETGDTGVRLADRAVGELAKMHARIGDADALQNIFEEIGNRTISGSAGQLIAGAKQALWLMRNRPEIAYRCGPLALKNICALLNPPVDVNEIVLGSASIPEKGFSLSQLVQLAQDLKLNFQVAKRLPGASVIVPCVVHWNVGHYAAIVQQQGGHYFVVDPTFGLSRWVSQQAIDSESSGYFLIPPGSLTNNWESVSDTAAQTIWGRGVTGTSDPNNTAPYDLMADPNCDSKGMARFNAHLMLVSLHIEDTPLSFAPPRGPPIKLTATYNQSEANQPANFNFSNFGQDWTCNWISYLTDNGTNTAGDIQYYIGGGGTEIFTYQTNGSYIINWRNQASLVRLSTNSYQMAFPDGSTNIFSQPDGSVGNSRRVFLTRVIDPTGYTNILNYDSSLRLVSVTDPQAGLTNLIFFYDASVPAFDPYVIQKVTDRYGRSATFGYGTSLLQLQSITDVLGLTSQVFYASSTFINALQTPYGTSTFAFGDDGAVRWLELTDPQGGKSRLEYNQQTSTGIPNSDPGTTVPRGMYTRNYLLFGRNTFYWDKKALDEAPGDYSKARLYHWLHNADLASAEGALESFKEPLEHRVWFNYPGQASGSAGATIFGGLNLPSSMGRVLDDGSTQFYQTYRNALGKITNSIDPLGRSFTFVYAANQIDLLEVRQTRGTNNELVASFTYNSQHLPLSAKDAAGQTNKLSYNTYGQITGFTNALSQVTSFTYDSAGRLLNVVGPTNTAITSYAYDAFDRVQAVTNADGYWVTTAYDAFDRPLTNAYPNGTVETMAYLNLDPLTYTDRGGKVTQFIYDSIRHLTQITEATNWTTRFGWCDCGGLSTMTDPLGRITTWLHDIQGRVTAKQYADGSSVHYAYERTTSRVQYFTNERGQTKTNYYHQDDTLYAVVYANQSVTPTVILLYDTNYCRLTALEDGTGSNYFSYYPITATPTLGAGRLKTIQAWTAVDALTYTYDALGRVLSDVLTNSLFSPAAYVYGNTFAYDLLGRVSTDTTKDLGIFTNTYVGVSARLASILYPVSQSTTFAYYDIQTDLRLKTINNSFTGTLLSSFDYAYNAEGRMTNQVGRLTRGGTNSPRTTTNQFSYDGLRQLSTASSNSSLTYFQYSYDLAGNRTTEQNNGSSWRAWFNPLNQIAGKDRGLSSTSRTLAWDEENRLISVTEGGLQAQMVYDAVGRLAYLLETTNGALLMQHWFIWSGGKIAEELFAGADNNPHFFWYYDYGYRDYNAAGNVYITRDVRGSVHEYDNGGNVTAQYDYDPYGRQLILSQSTNIPSFGFAGMYSVPGHNLNLASHRVYDPDLGKWLSRDPTGEAGGINLYQYVGNDPVNFIDLSGFCAQRGFVGGRGQSRDPNSGKIVDSSGEPSRDQLNPLNPINFTGQNSPLGSEGNVAAEAGVPRITEAGLSRIEGHLASIVAEDGSTALGDRANQAMLARLRAGQTAPQDINFYVHELKESARVGAGLDQQAAHEAALQWQGIPYKTGYESQLYHPDVIRQFSTEFNRAAWPK
jgi:RHS repeat-associated protein